MSQKDYPRNQQQNDEDCQCKEKDTPTQKSINRDRLKLCATLYDTSGKVTRLEKKFKGEKKLYNDKTCLFNNTEENYRRYRNLSITVGTELLQTNESMKGNVKTYNEWNASLNKILKDGIAKAVKDVKAKMSELKDAACKLDSCLNDKCNQAQKTAITGEKPENCKEDPKEPPQECQNAGEIFKELICIPKGLTFDIDSIFQSSADVVGIQLFSNIDTLDPLQKKLEEQSKQFEKHITDTARLREGDLKKLQEELVKSVKEVTKAAIERNTTRSLFEGYKDAVNYICCPKCKCVDEECGCHDNDDKKKNNDNECCGDLSKPRLEKCEEDICEICDDVKKTFCCDKEPEKPSKGC